MLNIWLSSLCLIFLVACSGQQTSKTELKVTSGFAITSTSGGMMLYLKNKSTNQVRGISIQSTTYTVDLTNGAWDFSVIGWDGPNPMSGNLFCGKTSVNLNGGSQAVDLVASQALCDSDTFSPTNLRFNGLSSSLRLISCETVAGITSPGTWCDGAAKGMTAAYRIRFIDFPFSNPAAIPLTSSGLDSGCQPASGSSQSMTEVLRPLPYGSSIDPLPTVVELYSNSSCTSGKKVFYFPRGLGFPQDQTAESGLLVSGEISELYLRHPVVAANLTIAGSGNFGQLIQGNQEESLTFTVTNTGSLPAESVVVTAPPTPFSLGINNCQGTLNPQASCSFTVTMQSSMVGTHGTTLGIEYHNGISLQSATKTLTGTTITPASLIISHANHDFGNVFIGNSSHQTFSVINIGEAAATGLSFMGLSGALSSNSTCGMNLAGGASCEFTVTFSPTSTASSSTTLFIYYHNGALNAESSLALNGTGAQTANLSLSGLSEFGIVPNGGSADLTLTLTNLDIDSVVAQSISGSIAAPFDFKGGSFPGTGGTCGTMLSGGATCTIVVTFAPTSSGVQSFNLVINFFNGLSSVSTTRTLNGEGVAPANLSISDSPSYNFGNEVLVGTPLSKTFTVTNTGGVAATSVQVAGYPGSFTVLGHNCPTTIDPGSSCTFHVEFDPSSSGPFSSSAEVDYHNAVTTQTSTVSLIGRGVAVGTIDPIWTSAPNWNDYANQFTTECNPTSDTDCRHGGERRITQLPSEFTSCSSLTFTETLGAFDWSCSDNGGAGPVTFSTLKLKKGKGLKDLVDWNAWKQNSFRVFQGGFLVYVTPLTNWWTNPVVNLDGLHGLTTSQPLPYSAQDGSVIGMNTSGSSTSGTLATLSLVNPSTIYTVTANITIPGLYLGANKLALVTLGVATIGATNTTLSNCNTTNGQISGANVPSLICSGGFHHTWLEIQTSVPQGSNNFVAVLYNQNWGRVHNSKISGGQEGMIFAGSTHPNIVTSTVFQNYLNYGLQLNAPGHRIQDCVFYGGAFGLGMRLLANNSRIYRSKFLNSTTGLSIATSGNIVGDILLTGNGSNGLRVNDTTGVENIFYNITAVNNNGNGISLDNSANRNTFINVMSNNNTDGLRLNNVHNNTFVNVLLAGNSTSGLVMNGSNGNQFNRVVAANNFNNMFFGNILNNVFTIVGTSGTSNDCMYGSGSFTSNTMNGSQFDSTPCSGVTLDNLSIIGSFRGSITSDAINTIVSPNAGVVPFASLTPVDFYNFENLFRTWAKNTDLFLAGNTGPCNTGTCFAVDWRLKDTDTMLLNRSQSLSSPNISFAPDGICPINGTVFTANQMLTPINFLTLATEFFDDGIGNDNGLCESGEKCIYAPNIGSYQGDGAFQTCTFTNGTISNVTLGAREFNGTN